MQDHYNLLSREEEREMLPLCVDAGVGTVPWSPLARGLLTRPPQSVTERSEADRRTTGFLYRNTESDTAIIDAVGAVANKHGVNRAQVALAWLRSKPPVVAPLVGASKLSRIDDAIASLALALDADDIAALEGPYRPQVDTQNVTDNALIEATTRAMGMIAHRPPKWGASGVAR